MDVKSQVEGTCSPGEVKGVSLEDENELNQKLGLVPEHLSSGRFEQALAELRELERRWPDSERVQYWARVLAPPIVRSAPGPDPRSRPLDQERAWLRQHGREYPGCWLAVYEDRLIAADPDLEVVLSEASRTPEGQRALLYLQPGRPKTK